jgi:outer membrane protein TolC
MIKAPLLIFVLFQFASINAQGSAKNLILNYLEDISGQSKTLKALEDQRLATELESKSELSTYDWNTYLNASFYQQDTPPLSPFTSTKQEQWKYGPGIEKKWSSGIKTELSYSILDNTTQFSTNPTFSTLSPTLELKLTSKVFQDILGDASKLEILKTKQKSKWQRFRLQLNKKETIVRALLDYVKLLETNEELRLQNDLCNSVQSQVKKLNQKFKTRSISKREYLLGQKELTLCRANIQTLQKSLREQKNITETTFSINISTYLNTNSEQLFNTIVDQYKLLPKASSKLRLFCNV